MRDSLLGRASVQKRLPLLPLYVLFVPPPLHVPGRQTRLSQAKSRAGWTRQGLVHTPPAPSLTLLTLPGAQASPHPPPGHRLFSPASGVGSGCTWTIAFQGPQVPFRRPAGDQ